MNAADEVVVLLAPDGEDILFFYARDADKCGTEDHFYYVPVSELRRSLGHWREHLARKNWFTPVTAAEFERVVASLP